MIRSKIKQIFAESTDTETFCFNSFNFNCGESVGGALNSCNKFNKKPIVVCVGSDLVLGDSLGPLVGTMLVRCKAPAYIYGTLSSPVTAKEIACAKVHLKMLHPESFAVAIDAAVGNAEDIGLIKVANKGLKPGLGVDKNLGILGDCSIIGVVAERSKQNYNLFNLTRLNLIYKMAEQIADGVDKFLRRYAEQNQITA
ncbi:MAG: spore protease YyaC [Clostridia bacterium]|nr:spore protease YyaC [Clostridia bacterium]